MITDLEKTIPKGSNVILRFSSEQLIFQCFDFTDCASLNIKVQALNVVLEVHTSENVDSISKK